MLTESDIVANRDGDIPEYTLILRADRCNNFDII